MSKMTTLRENNQASQMFGRTALQVNSKQPNIERKISDPSSCNPKGERYPIPSFFEYRVKAREYDPL